RHKEGCYWELMAFVLGRRISDNILITQELMYSYHRNRGPPRCAFKVDIQKAYDTIDWEFLGKILKHFGFHPIMVKWIMTCVTSTSFSLSINGDIHGCFNGKRGLRRGDPLSPYHFTLIMEVLTLILKRRGSLSESFCYHKHYEELQLINVCFADNLFIFARGDVDSARIIMEGLDEFRALSGLVSSIPKSTVFICNVMNHVKNSILNIMPFSEGKLPVNIWESVISSMQVYWASVLAIPKGIILDIHQLIRGFLWCNGEYKRGKAKVTWSDICLSKSEGGLGLRSLEIFNMALMSTHIWNIVSNKESIWVRWIHTYKLRGCSLGYSHEGGYITREGFSLQDCVINMVSNDGWKWPQSWLLKAPDLGLVLVPHLVANKSDVPHWRNRDDSFSDFLVRSVWEEIRPREAEVWKYVRHLADMDSIQPCFHDVVTYLQPMAKKRTTQSIVERLIFAASSYFIWIERNNRLCKKIRRPPDEIRDLIIVTVRLKLISFGFKNKDNVNRLLARWKMPRNFRLYGS
nr:hypothetical protein [Tanacetum cinerariifolium]